MYTDVEIKQNNKAHKSDNTYANCQRMIFTRATKIAFK